MTTAVDALNRRLDEIIEHLAGYMSLLESDGNGGYRVGPPKNNPLAAWVYEEIRYARWSEPDDWGLRFKRSAIRAFEETRYYQTFVRTA